MENSSAEHEHNIHEFFKKLLFQRDQRIEKLEQELAANPAMQGIPVAEVDKKFAALQKNFEEKNAHATSQNNAQKVQIQQLTETIRQMQGGYENLRRQKGGFGMLSMTLCFLASTLFGFVLHKLFFAKSDPQAVVFENFRNAHQFDFEYQISQGQFDKVETTLKNSLEKNEYQGIKSELEFFKKIMGAARRSATGNISNDEAGKDFIVNPKADAANIQEKAKKSLTITQNEVTIRSEASTSGEKLGKLKKGETAGVWDKTTSIDKFTTILDGKRIEVSDYWYKIEAPNGTEGWVFGYFTNRSMKRFSYLDPPPTDTLSAPKPVPASNQIPNKPANGG